MLFGYLIIIAIIGIIYSENVSSTYIRELQILGLPYNFLAILDAHEPTNSKESIKKCYFSFKTFLKIINPKNVKMYFQ